MEAEPGTIQALDSSPFRIDSFGFRVKGISKQQPENKKIVFQSLESSSLLCIDEIRFRIDTPRSRSIIEAKGFASA